MNSVTHMEMLTVIRRKIESIRFLCQIVAREISIDLANKLENNIKNQGSAELDDRLSALLYILKYHIDMVFAHISAEIRDETLKNLKEEADNFAFEAT